VRVVYASIDPTQRIWASDMPQYMTPVAVGDPMRSSVIGVVETSKNPHYSVGDILVSFCAIQEYFMIEGAGSGHVKLDKALLSKVPLTEFLNIFGHIGATAYIGLLEIGKPKEGETVVVSGAAGATGSLVGQIAKIKGCRVVGLAGTDEKCDYLHRIGFDAAINYKKENIAEALTRHCPKGVDVFFDNVGGETLDIVWQQMNNFGRIAMCGMISQYNQKSGWHSLSNFPRILMNRLKVEGFICSDYQAKWPEYFKELGVWYAQGKLHHNVHVVRGIENTVKAINMLFRGENTGKLLLQISDEPSVV